MATAHVQHGSNRTDVSGNTIAVTLTGVAAGSTLAAFAYGDSPPATITMSDGVNTWTQDQTNSDGYRRRTTAYAKNVAAGDTTITATFPVAIGNKVLIVHEISGADTTAPLNTSVMPAFQDNPGSGTDAVTTGNMTTTVDGCYICAFTTNQAAVQTYAAGTGYTERASADNLVPGFCSESLIQTSAGNIAGTFTLSSGSGRNYNAAMAFKPAAGGASAEGGGMLLSSRRNRLTIP